MQQRGEGVCVVPFSGAIGDKDRGIAPGEREKWYPRELLLTS